MVLSCFGPSEWGLNIVVVTWPTWPAAGRNSFCAEVLWSCMNCGWMYRIHLDFHQWKETLAERLALKDRMLTGNRIITYYHTLCWRPHCLWLGNDLGMTWVSLAHGLHSMTLGQRNTRDLDTETRSSYIITAVWMILWFGRTWKLNLKASCSDLGRFSRSGCALCLAAGWDKLK